MQFSSPVLPETSLKNARFRACCVTNYGILISELFLCCAGKCKLTFRNVCLEVPDVLCVVKAVRVAFWLLLYPTNCVHCLAFQKIIVHTNSSRVSWAYMAHSAVAM